MPYQPQTHIALSTPLSASSNDMINFFFAQFVEPAQSSRWPGWISSLPDRYAASPDNACFKPALLAASYAILHKKDSNPEHQYTAQAFYVSAIEAISQALKKKEFCQSTMMAICLLDLFQTIMDDEESASYGTHLDGLRAILELQQKGKHLVESPSSAPAMYRNLNPGCGTSIFEFMPQIARLFHALRLRHQPDQATVDWVASLNTQFAGAVSCNSLLKFAQVSAQATTIAKELGEKIANFELDLQLTNTKLTDVLEYAKEVDDKSQTWWQNRDPRWVVTRKPTSSGQNFFDHALLFYDCYQDLWVACVWNVYRASRMILHNTISECLDTLLLCTPFSESYSLNTVKLQELETIRSMAEDIRASVPFVLGRVDSNGLEQEGEATALSGQSLLWPLNVMQQMKTAPMTDRLWASDVLVEIGQRTGIRRAWMLAKRRIETGDTPKFEDCDVGYGVRASEIPV